MKKIVHGEIMFPPPPVFKNLLNIVNICRTNYGIFKINVFGKN